MQRIRSLIYHVSVVFSLFFTRSLLAEIQLITDSSQQQSSAQTLSPDVQTREAPAAALAVQEATHELQLIFFLQPQEGPDVSVNFTDLARVLTKIKERDIKGQQGNLSLISNKHTSPYLDSESRTTTLASAGSRSSSHTATSSRDAPSYTSDTGTTNLSQDANSHKAAASFTSSDSSPMLHSRQLDPRNSDSELSQEQRLNSDHQPSQTHLLSQSADDSTKLTDTPDYSVVPDRAHESHQDRDGPISSEPRPHELNLSSESQKLLAQGYRVCELRIPLIHKRLSKKTVFCEAVVEESSRHSLVFEVDLDLLLDRYLHMKGDIWLTQDKSQSYSVRTVNQLIKKDYWTYLDHSRFGLLARYQPLVVAASTGRRLD